MELLVRSSLAATKSPFSKAFVRLEKLVPESPAVVLISLENSAVRQFPARWSGGARLPTSRGIQALLDFAFRAARGDVRSTAWIQLKVRSETPAARHARPGRLICGFQIRDE